MEGADVSSTLEAFLINCSRLSGGESAACSRDILAGITPADNYIELPNSSIYVYDYTYIYITYTHLLV